MIKYFVRFWRYNNINNALDDHNDIGLFDSKSDAYNHIQMVCDRFHGINYRVDTSCDWDEVVFETPDNMFRCRFTVLQEE